MIGQSFSSVATLMAHDEVAYFSRDVGLVNWHLPIRWLALNSPTFNMSFGKIPNPKWLHRHVYIAKVGKGTIASFSSSS